ncbi:MAG: AraC family transcriptional regulator [Acidobacteria bacterium]|nr:AraC family transcriptional regulator [Acidobacteriota bacterium]
MSVQILSDTALEQSFQEKRLELAALIERFTSQDGAHQTAITPLCLFRASSPSEPVHAVYEPALCLVAQGAKEVLLADELYRYDQANYLLVAVDLPIVGQVIEARPEVPYLGLRLNLDPREINALMIEAGIPAPASPGSGRGLTVSRIEPQLLDAVVRMVRLLETPQDIRLLMPLIMREILYRLLTGEQSTQLRQIALANSQTQRIAKVINWLKFNYDKPLRIENIAREVNMSPSALHHHFKAVTAMSPLQYQKQIRLQEARRLMLSEALDAATASFNVGYESPSQFSREYSRLFGAPPQRDIARLRSAS